MGRVGVSPPSPPAVAPRDGGGAGAGLALPFLFACLEQQRFKTSRPAEDLGGEEAVGGIMGGLPAAGGALRSSHNTRHRKCERTATPHTSQGASNPPIRGRTHTSAQNLTQRHSAPHGRRGHITTVAEPGTVAQTATGCLPPPPRTTTHTCTHTGTACLHTHLWS